MRLALAVGEPNPDRLLETMTSRQLDEWRAYFALQDEDDWEDFKVQNELDNLRAARVCASVGNFSGRAKRLLHPADFMPGEKAKTESVGEELLEAFKKLGAEEAG